MDWNTERISRISRQEGTVPYKWCEDQLIKIVNTRVAKADEATKTGINALAEAEALAKDDPALRKRLSATFGPKFSANNRTSGSGTRGDRKRPPHQDNSPAKKPKPSQPARQAKQSGPQFCR